jgi:hypothetical protein
MNQVASSPASVHLAASRRLAVRPHAAPGPAPSLGSVRASLPNLILLPGLLIESGAQAPDFPIHRSDLPAQSLNVGARREIEQVQEPRGNAIDLITNPAPHAGLKGRGAGELTGVYTASTQGVTVVSTAS